MRRICLLSAIAAMAFAGAIASPASAVVIEACVSNASAGAGVPLPATSPAPPEVPYMGITTGPSCTLGWPYSLTGCSAGDCRAMVIAYATAGVAVGRVSAYAYPGTQLSADCGPVALTIAGGECKASINLPAGPLFGPTCSMEGVAAVQPTVLCVVERPPFQF